MTRARWTPKQIAQQRLDQRNLCGCGCGHELDNVEGIVGEHVWEFVALGNSGKPDKLYRKPCADKKTNGPSGDLNTIAHVKRLRDARTQHDRRNARSFPLIRGGSIRGWRKFDGTPVRKA